jgi:hypothetical protein
MKQNFVGSIYGKSSVTIAHLFLLDPLTNMAATDNSCFCLIDLQSFVSFGQTVSEEKNLKKSVNQKQELPVVAMFVNGSGRN